MEVACAFVKHFIMKVDSKKASIILNGPPNTGKSAILDFMRRIFNCAVERIHRGNTIDHESTEGV
jgi:replication-associated recombination protein RarA